MNIKIHKTKLQEILSLRALFLQENNFQIRYNACHERNWSDSYLLTFEGKKIGYGSVKGKEALSDRDAVFEFYVIPAFRKKSSLLFSKLLEASNADFIECQSNDFLLSSMLYEFAQNIYADYFLFADDIATEYKIPGLLFRPRRDDDDVFGLKAEDAGEYVLERDGLIVATGGFLRHYNIPFADLYMEVKEDCRGEGLGSYILQEVKKECYFSGRVPAARCPVQHKASKATLIKAGMRVCGVMLIGEVK